MRFKVPGQDINVRLFERVETVDSQYDIFDVGIEQADGSIDSMVVGGSFSLLKSLAKKADENADKKAETKQNINDSFVLDLIVRSSFVNIVNIRFFIK